MALLALGLGMMACSNNVEDVNESKSQAAFQISEVKALNVTLKSDGISKDWREITNKAAITLQTCLKDSVFRGLPILGEKFEIRSSLSSQTIHSDANGCLEWKEQLEYNYLSQEKYYLVSYILNGVGKFKGEVEFQLGINPWVEGTAAVIEDPQDEWAEEKSIEEDSYQLKSRSEEKNLALNKAQITFLKKNQDPVARKQYLHYRLDLMTSLKRMGLSGEVIQRPIQVGRYQIQLELYQKQPGKEKKLISTSTIKETIGENGHIPGEFSFLIPNDFRQINAALLEVGIHIIPLHAPLALGSAHAILVLDSISNPTVRDVVDNIDWSEYPQSMTVEIKPDESEREDELGTIEISAELPKKEEKGQEQNKPNDETFEAVVEEDSSKEEPINEEGHFGYSLKKVELKRGSIVSANFNKSSKKVVRAKFKTCLVDPLSSNGNSPIQDARFRVDIKLAKGHDDGVQEDRSYPVDNSGCFDSYAHIPFDRFDKEHFIPFEIHIEGLTAPYKGIRKSRQVVINPWNPSDFGYDLKFESEPAEINGEYPRLHMEDIVYTKEGMNYDSFRLNEDLHLSFKKKYQLSIQPKVEIFTSYREESDTDKLTFGNYKLKAIILSPKAGEINYLKPNMEQFNFFTAAESEVEVGPSGLIQTLLEFPMMVSDAYLLSYKNLLVLELTPKEKDSKLRPVTHVIPFFGNAKKASIKSALFEGKLTENMNKKAAKLIADKAFVLESQSDKGPLEKYRDYFLNGPDSRPIEGAYSLSLEEFNKLQPIGGRWEKRSGYNFDKWYKKLTSEDLELLTNGSTKIANGRLAKICRVFYQLPVTTRGGKSHEGGEDFQDCLKNPKDHIKFTPIGHIQKIRSKKRLRDANRKIIDSYTIGNYKKSVPQIGKVFRGKAFFAAYGDYSWDSSGYGRREGSERKINYGLEFPGTYFVGFSEGYSTAQETFVTHTDVKTEAYFDRNYTQLQKLDLDYNALTLEFSAQIRKCAAFTSKKKIARKLHLCREDDEPEFITENWFFVGDVNSDDHGIIVDGTRPGATDQAQIIRGKANFDRLWGKMRNEDTRIVISELDEINLEGSFSKNRDKDFSLPLENVRDNSFPGLYIPLKKY